MELSLYLGKVQFNIISPFDIPLREMEIQFNVPVFSTEKKIAVVVEETEIIDTFEGILIRKDRNSEIRMEDGREYRYYLDGLYRKCYAESLEDDNRLVIRYSLSSKMRENINFSIINLIQAEKFLLRTGGMVLHCAYIRYNQDAILFTAPSGTGKSTQASLWETNRNGVTVINGDKALLQKEDDYWYAGGFPLHGTARECLNEKTKLKAIVIVRQAKKDEVVELTAAQKIKLLFSEITVNMWSSEAVEQVLNLIERLVSSVTVIQLNCTMNQSAVETLEQYLYGE